MLENEMTGENVRSCGRNIMKDKILYLGYSGSFVEFTGEFHDVTLGAVGVKETSEGDYPAYLGIFIDEEKRPENIIRVEEGLNKYDIYHGKRKGKIKIRIVKLTESQYDKVGLRVIWSDGKIMATEPEARRLLFVGDSITAGYGVSGSAEDCSFHTISEDVTKAYPYMISRQLKADSHIVCWSGGGIISRWIPPEEEEPLTDILMPAIFPYTELTLGKKLEMPSERLSGTEFVPELIVVNLGTNDASYTRENEKKEKTFEQEYVKFITNVSNMYGQAEVLLVYGMMEKTLLPVIEKVTQRCKASGIRCEFFHLPEMRPEDGLGTNGHPSYLTQQKMTKLIAEKIREQTGWRD